MPAYTLEGPKWASTTITWSFASYNYPSDSGTVFSHSMSDLFKPVIVAAFRRWASVTPLRFVQVDDAASASAAADIRVGFGTFNPAGTGTIGLTNYRYSGSTFLRDAIVRLEDPAELPVTGSTVADLKWSGYVGTVYEVALHEIGHALGLGHSSDALAVMYPVATASNGDLDAADIAGIQALYGTPLAGAAQSVRRDVSGDGRADLVWQNANGAPSVWTMQAGAGGASVAGYVTYQNPGASWRLVGTGDLNGDGRADLVWQNTASGLPSGWLVGVGGAGVQGYPVFQNPGQDWRLVGTGDLNGDGRDDLLWQRGDGLPSGWLMGGDGATVAGYPVFANPGSDWRLVGAADLNGDGRDDLLWQRSDGLPSAWLMNAAGTGVAGYPVFANPGASWRLVGAADLNGDGRDDLLWQNANGTPSAWLMNAAGTGVAGYPVFSNPGASWTLRGAADANGDGRADLVWQNANGTPSLWVMGAGGTTVEGYPVLANPGAEWRLV